MPKIIRTKGKPPKPLKLNARFLQISSPIISVPLVFSIVPSSFIPQPIITGIPEIGAPQVRSSTQVIFIVVGKPAFTLGASIPTFGVH